MLLRKAGVLAGLNRAAYEAGIEGSDPEIFGGVDGRLILMSALEGAANRTITNLLDTGEADRLDWGLLLVTFCDGYLDGVIDRLATSTLHINLGSPLWPSLVTLHRLVANQMRWRANAAVVGTFSTHASSPYLAVASLSEKLDALTQAPQLTFHEVAHVA